MNILRPKITKGVVDGIDEDDEEEDEKGTGRGSSCIVVVVGK